ncbi:MAG: hypothetical protein K0S24_2973 [Sphingobacterium sp.]|jgi:hypothetical protein|nr:hypothetical protein [Sphingobacterium sp.]
MTEWFVRKNKVIFYNLKLSTFACFILSASYQ